MKVTEARKIIKQLELLTQSVKRLNALRDAVEFGRNIVANNVGVGSYVRTLEKRMMGQAHAEERMWRKLESICIELDPNMFQREDFVQRDLSLIECELDLLDIPVTHGQVFPKQKLGTAVTNPPSEGEVYPRASDHASNPPSSNPPNEGEVKLEGEVMDGMFWFARTDVAKTNAFTNVNKSSFH